MKIEDYELLLQLHKVGTVRKTAKVIMISQPAVSQRLKFIEDYFGEQIFIRTAKKLELTPSGEIIIDHAEKVIQHETALKNTLALSSEEVRGTLSIACSTVISQQYMPSILAKFTKMYPFVSVELVTGLSEHLRNELNNYHVTIIRGEKDAEHESHLLLEDPLYIFDTESFTTEAVKKRPLISFKSDDSLQELTNNWLFYHQAEIKSEQVISVDQIETCKQFMKEGLGMAVLPESVSKSLKETYPHLPLMMDGQLVTRDTWLCYRSDMRKLPQVNSFIELLLREPFV